MSWKGSVKRLFDDSGPPLSGERFETLAASGGVVIKRIISAPGTASGPYRQSDDEWVMVLQGDARLDLDGTELRLSAGEALMIPARTPHRVLETSGDPPCIWLTVHTGGQETDDAV